MVLAIGMIMDVGGRLMVRESVSAVVDPIWRVVIAPHSDTSSINDWSGSWFLVEGGAVLFAFDWGHFLNVVLLDSGMMLF